MPQAGTSVNTVANVAPETYCIIFTITIYAIHSYSCLYVAGRHCYDLAHDIYYRSLLEMLDAIRKYPPF